MATIYSPSSATGGYYSKKLVTPASRAAEVAATAATPFGSSSFNMYPNGQLPVGSSTIGQTVGGGPTIYAPAAQAPAAPSLASQAPSFMTQTFQPRVVSVTPTPAAQQMRAAAMGQGGAGGTAPAQPQDFSNVTALLQKQLAAANAANESRYSQLLALADQQGQSQMQASQRLRTQELGNATASLTNRGLGNSTIVDTTRRGIVNDAAVRNQGIANSVAANKAGIIERRTDQAPDLGMYAQLLAQPGGAGMAEALLKASAPKAPKKK